MKKNRKASKNARYIMSVMFEKRKNVNLTIMFKFIFFTKRLLKN